MLFVWFRVLCLLLKPLTELLETDGYTCQFRGSHEMETEEAAGLGALGDGEAAVGKFPLFLLF